MAIKSNLNSYLHKIIDIISNEMENKISIWPTTTQKLITIIKHYIKIAYLAIAMNLAILNPKLPNGNVKFTMNECNDN